MMAAVMAMLHYRKSEWRQPLGRDRTAFWGVRWDSRRRRTWNYIKCELGRPITFVDRTQWLGVAGKEIAGQAEDGGRAQCSRQSRHGKFVDKKALRVSDYFWGVVWLLSSKGKPGVPGFFWR
jgi:hypothetical protein